MPVGKALERPFSLFLVDRCTPGLRKQFNENLIRQFKIEFERVVKRKNAPPRNMKRNTKLGLHLIHGERGYTLNSTELRVVEWKFSELDLDHDNTLSFRELRSLRRVVRRVVRPRDCARRFAKRCDANKNRRLERKEWSLCMGINTVGMLSSLSLLRKIIMHRDQSTSDFYSKLLHWLGDKLLFV